VEYPASLQSIRESIDLILLYSSEAPTKLAAVRDTLSVHPLRTTLWPLHVVSFSFFSQNRESFLRFISSLLSITVKIHLATMMRAALQKSGGFASKSMVGKPTSSIGAVRTMAKEIKFGVEGRAAMLRGVDVLADAVQVRLKIRFRIR